MSNIANKFCFDKFSLKQMIFKTIVVNGLDKKSKLDKNGSVCFNPIKLNNSAKKITTAIIKTLKKYFLM